MGWSFPRSARRPPIHLSLLKSRHCAAAPAAKRDVVTSSNMDPAQHAADIAQQTASLSTRTAYIFRYHRTDVPGARDGDASRLPLWGFASDEAGAARFHAPVDFLFDNAATQWLAGLTLPQGETPEFGL